MSQGKSSRRVVLANRPQAGPIQDDTFKVQTETLTPLNDGEVLVRVEYVSVDPTMRGWINDVRGYLPPVKVGAVMRAAGIGYAIASRSGNIPVGTLVSGMLGWQEHWQGPAERLEILTVPRGGEVYDHLGLFGSSGPTAYFGMFDVGRLKDGETVLISGAAGSVGLVATQIALSHPKCRVIAIAGTDAKCTKLKDMGCHQVLNYKAASFKSDFRKIGLLDVFFDNVGGQTLDMALRQLNPHARIVMCGAIADYNAKEPYGLRSYTNLISQKATMQGFIYLDYLARQGEAVAYLADLKDKGRLQYEYTFRGPGVEHCVGALQALFEGKNDGKMLVKLWKDDFTPSKL